MSDYNSVTPTNLSLLSRLIDSTPARRVSTRPSAVLGNTRRTLVKK